MSTAALVIAIVLAVYALVGLVVIGLGRAARRGDEQAYWARLDRELDQMIFDAIHEEDDHEHGAKS